MIKNYFKIAFRSLIYNKVYSFINILGLTLGMTCAVLIILWIQDELSYDSFHADAEQIYQVLRTDTSETGVSIERHLASPVGPALVEKFPEVTQQVRLINSSQETVFEYKGQQTTVKRRLFTENNFFQIFSFPLVHGNPENVLQDPGSLVISESVAKNIFKDENPIGKSLRLNYNKSFKITGVMEDVPANSHLQFDFIIPLNYIPFFKDSQNRWHNYWLSTYVRLDEKANVQALEPKLVLEGTQSILQPLREIYLYADQGQGAKIQNIYIFGFVAFFILLIACINFMNLSTARSMRRAKEVGLRKVVGAYRFQLVFQFLGESLIVSSVSLVLAAGLIELILPSFNQLADKHLNISLLNLNYILLILGVMVLTGLLAGSYPAFVLSAFRPIKVLKGNFQTSKQGMQLRRGLVVTQFSLSVILIICTIVVFSQLHYMQNKKLGFNRENVLKLPIRQDLASVHYKSLKQKLLSNPQIAQVSAATNSLAGIFSSTTDVQWPGKPKDFALWITIQQADFNFLETFQIPLKEGRHFSSKLSTDSTNYIINEKAAELMGLEDPLGQTLSFWGNSGKIIGVAENFHFKSLYHSIDPLIFVIDPGEASDIYIRLQSDNIRETMAFIEKTWNTYNTQYPFEFTFVNQEFDRLYKKEEHLSQIFTYFALLAIFISCLGVFGLGAFTAQQRRKEIGIRKVLGASIPHILSLITKDFVYLVLIASVIAMPIAYYFMFTWLQEFAYRIHLLAYWYVFISSGILALLIALLTISSQAWQAARVNPVEVLKDE